jgi:hypothetical protein
LQTQEDIQTICADFLGQDMRTTNNTLSVWRSETLNPSDLDNAIKAALLTCSQVNATQFIILDSEALSRADISTSDEQPGKTAYKGLENLHTDLCELTYEKIGTLLQLYQDASSQSDRIPKIEKKRFKEIIVEAHSLGALDISVLQDHMQKEVAKVIGSLATS